ncbi:SEC-C metal-binding domain-containing protein [Ramlibacter albus]|uniref:SEC-C metal-binding domain-containing protein n=1 Tax=Ramlibacter albus TaxID=2079448 RepID=UPI001C9A8348
MVGGYKELREKLGRNDPCPCGSGLRFQAVLHAQWRARRLGSRSLLLGSDLAA